MLPIREAVEHIALRIKFAKTGNLQYISHLDLQRTFTRVLVRANIPVWYSEGFSPHPRLVFATPLSVGAQSISEFMDVNIIGSAESIDIDGIRNTLLALKIEGLKILDAYLPSTKFSTITDAEYKITVHAGGVNDDVASKFEQFVNQQPLVIVKKTKSGEKETDISPYVRGVSASVLDGDLVIKARLCADNSNFLNPEYLVKILKSQFGILSGSLADEVYSIMREDVYSGENLFR